MKEKGGTELRSPVGPLPIHRGRIMIRPEHVQQVVIRNPGWVVLHLNYFRMASRIAAHILVGRIVQRAAKVSDCGSRHSRQLPESCFHTPKTSRAKGSR